MASAITPGSAIYIVLFIVLLVLFILTLVYDNVHKYKTGFVFICIIGVWCFLYLTIYFIRSGWLIGRPLEPKFTFVPRSYTSLDVLPVNRYPFYGSHDSGTYVQKNNNHPRLVELIGLSNDWLFTQSRDFIQQYQHGVRFLDCRFQYFATDNAITFRHGSGIAVGEDVGGIFFPINDSHYASLDQFFSQAITDHDIVVLKVSKEVTKAGDRPLYANENMALWTGNYFTTNPSAGNTSIMANLAFYLSHTHSGANYLSHTVFVSSPSQLDQSVASYKNSGKYIFAVMSNFINDNWVDDVVCQPAPYSSLNFSHTCNTSTCINPDDATWTTGATGAYHSTGLFSYMNNVGTAYNTVSNTNHNLNITQAMFQSYAGLSNLWQGLPLPIQDCTGGQITNLDSYAHVTYRVYDYLRNNPTYLSNVTIMDNIGVEMSPIMINGVAISWSKMVAYQLKENYLNAVAARNPFLTQYGL